MKNLDELMMKMCASKNDGVGVEVDGLIYFYEDFENDKGIERANNHFGADNKMTFYSMTWAHQRRIKELMDLYKELQDKHSDRVNGMAGIIADFIAEWSSLSYSKALEQVQNLQVSYLSIV